MLNENETESSSQCEQHEQLGLNSKQSSLDKNLCSVISNSIFIHSRFIRTNTRYVIIDVTTINIITAEHAYPVSNSFHNWEPLYGPSPHSI